MFKKINASIFFGFKLLLNFVTVKPAVENTLSEEVVVVGMHSSCLATYDTTLKRPAFNCHQTSGLSHLGGGDSVNNSELREGSATAASSPRSFTTAVNLLVALHQMEKAHVKFVNHAHALHTLYTSPSAL